MIDTIKLAALGIVALATSTSFAVALPYPAAVNLPTPQLDQPQRPPDLDCRMKGFDFWIINFGNANVDSGRQVAWSSPTTDDGAVITLPRMLAPGEELKLADVLSDVPYRGAPCTASFS